MNAFAAPPERVVLTNYSTADMRSRCAALSADKVFDKAAELDELLVWFKARPTRTH